MGLINRLGIGILLIGVGCLPAKGQAISWEMAAATGLITSGGGALPLWLHANSWGSVDPAGTNGYLQLESSFQDSLRSSWSWEVGAQLVGRISPHRTLFFPVLYARFTGPFVRLQVGRYAYEIGETAGSLSMGSLGTGSNATPMPKVAVETPGFLAVPGTRGLLQIRAYLAHGWFDDPRHTRRPYLHEKFLYGRLDAGIWQLYGGLVHSAQWGGISPIYGRQPQGIDDWWRIFWGMSGAPDAPPADQIYYQGNHLGIWDVGAKGRLGAFALHVYRHFIFEDKDGLKLKNPGDGLLGVVLTMPWLPLHQLVYEYLYTKRQSGPIPPGPGRGGPGGQDNYYNHWLYRSGWTYYGRTLSNPLFFPHPNGQILNMNRIANNRIVAHHVALEGQFAKVVGYVCKVTYSRNYGTYRDRDAARAAGQTYFYEKGPRQWSWYAALWWTLRPQLTLQLAVAHDQGQVYPRSTGAQLALRRQLH